MSGEMRACHRARDLEVCFGVYGSSSPKNMTSRLLYACMVMGTAGASVVELHAIPNIANQSTKTRAQHEGSD